MGSPLQMLRTSCSPAGTDRENAAKANSGSSLKLFTTRLRYENR